MTDVTAPLRASLSDRGFGKAIIWHAKNSISSNKKQVNAPLSAQFSRRYRWGYDRHH
jgi:hypothetical protein